MPGVRLLLYMVDQTPRRESGEGPGVMKDWGEVLTEVCRRPRMFTASADLDAALDFIGGYLYAQDLFTPAETEPEWRQFNYWLARKFDYPRNYAWYHVRAYFSTDEEALAAFPGYWLNSGMKEIISSTPQPNKRMHATRDTSLSSTLDGVGGRVMRGVMLLQNSGQT